MKPAREDIIEFIISIISDFASYFGLSEHQAYLYLKNHEAIEFVEKHYGVLHTLDTKETLESLAIFCRNKGGVL